MQQSADGRGRVLLRGGQDVGVYFHRHVDPRVAQSFTDDVDGVPACKQQRRARVPQLVELDPTQFAA